MTRNWWQRFLHGPEAEAEVVREPESKADTPTVKAHKQAHNARRRKRGMEPLYKR